MSALRMTRASDAGNLLFSANMMVVSREEGSQKQTGKHDDPCQPVSHTLCAQGLE